MKVYDANTPYEVQLVVRNKLGLHGRPAMAVADIARAFDGKIIYTNPDSEHLTNPVDAESIMGIMMTCAKMGHRIIFELYPSKPVSSDNLDDVRQVVGALENALAHDDE